MRIGNTIVIDEADIEESFVLNSGPGGQNVNKVHTAVQLRFRYQRCVALTEATKARLKLLAGARATNSGDLIIEAREYRTQAQNRTAARAKLTALIEKALRKPKPRHATRIPLSTKRKRLNDKRARSVLKENRRRPGAE